MPVSTLLSNYVAGEWTAPASGQAVEIREPARAAKVLWRAPVSDAAEVAAAIDAAAAAFGEWRHASVALRSGMLHAAAAHLEARTEQVATDVALEQGKTLAEARREVASAILSLRYFAGQALEPIGELLPLASGNGRIWAERVPVGPTVCITPWNFPLLIPTYKLAPALAFGNTVVLKPAALTPRSANHLIEALVAGGAPAGVVNICHAPGGEVASALGRSAPVRAVSFTGSNAVGLELRRLLVERDVRLQLEMGGKNAMLVLDDADIDAAAEIAVEGAMGMAGQKCTATSRVIVEAGVAGRFLELLRERIASVTVGHPLDDDVRMGPLISAEQRDKVLAAIDAGEAAGARLVSGGSLSGAAFAEGHYVAPTVFADVDPALPLAQEEIFGPVLAVIEAESDEHAVSIANGSRFGLTAAVCTNSLPRALQAIDRLDVGVVQINRPTSAIERQAPFGGTKHSGHGGREQGRAAREFYTEWKTVYLSADLDGGRA
ncbi:aldehyde dehydrogenase family protein [soil metagenome]